MKHHGEFYSVRGERIEYDPFHLNPNLRLLYILEGSVRLHFVSGEHVLNKGDVEIININEPVEMIKTDRENLILVFEFDGEKAGRYCDLIHKGIFNCNSTLFYTSVTPQTDQGVLKRKLRLFYRYYIDSAGDFLLEKEMREIVLFVCERCHDMKNMFRNAVGDDVREERFLRIYTYILENCHKKINLKELADSEYLSPQYLSKEFSDKLKINFKDTLEYFRIIQSVRYLISSSMTVTQISERCGFSAPRYFHKHFLVYMHCTPLEFKRTYLNRKVEIADVPVTDRCIREGVSAFEDAVGASDGAAAGVRGKKNTAAVLDEILETALGRPIWRGGGVCFAVRVESPGAKDRLSRHCARGRLASGAAVLLLFCAERAEGSELKPETAAEAAMLVQRLCALADGRGIPAAVVAGPAELGSAAEVGEILELPSGMTPVFAVAADFPKRDGERPVQGADKPIPLYRERYNVK